MLMQSKSFTDQAAGAVADNRVSHLARGNDPNSGELSILVYSKVQHEASLDRTATLLPDLFELPAQFDVLALGE